MKRSVGKTLLWLSFFTVFFTAQAQVTLDFWSGWADDQYKRVADEMISTFSAEHPDIEINHRTIENEQFFTVLRTAFASGSPPDVFVHEANNNLYQFVVPGEVEDISDWYVQPGHVERFSPGTPERGELRRRLLRNAP